MLKQVSANEHFIPGDGRIAGHGECVLAPSSQRTVLGSPAGARQRMNTVSYEPMCTYRVFGRTSPS